ncbi:hypothetical protein MKX03_019283 [Papaver bracteatum]|nr:hypothetical protein MKX03_019283 [Papaver bracteatum]
MLCPRRYAKLPAAVGACLTKIIISQNKVYVLRVVDFISGLAENREILNSGSSNDDLGLENDSIEDISSCGPPRPFPNLNETHVPLGREAMRGNDFSNTFFIDNTSPSVDNISVSNSDLFPPDQREPTCDNGENVIQPPFTTESLLD